jgi:two-component system nitrogen regulation response regulator GlnG
MAAEDAEHATTTGVAACSVERGVAAVPCLTLLYHPLTARVGERAVLASLPSGAAVRLSRVEPCFVAPGKSEGAPLGDSHVSRSPSRLLALVDGRIRFELGESRTRVVAQGQPLAGTRDFLVDEVRRGVVLELGDRIVLLLHFKSPSMPEASTAHLSATQQGDVLGMVGHSYFVETLRRDIRRVADLDVPVLVRGETGTGKELVAKAIHGASARFERPFIAVNMGAIPPSLASAELFGAERGAFTGADRRRPGYFNLADKGTLFLDEVGEAPAEVQAILLRALETGEIQAVGAQQPRRVDVRLITATDADLEARIAQGSFRAPLLHRLASYEIVLPPLRERREDIGRLVVHFLREELARVGEAHRMDPPGPGGGPWLPAALMVRLATYDWPGNVRQLRNVVRQLVVRSRGAASLEAGPALDRLLASPEPRLEPEQE